MHESKRIKKRAYIFLSIILIFTLCLSSIPLSAAASNLIDVEGHWAKDTIEAMVNKGIITGYPDGTFKPDKGITRAEFVSLLVKALSLEPGAGKVFIDTANHWAKDAISTANYYGIVSGYNDEIFGPDDLVTREQISIMVVNAIKVEPVKSAIEFIDSAQISPWAKDAVGKASALGLITGYPDGAFKPQASTTRAEAAVILSRCMKLAEKESGKTKFDSAGTYGPKSGMQTIDNDVVIDSDKVTLQNTTIEGSLTISENVGEGDVTLTNVIVKGTTFIRGGGKNSIHIDSGEYNGIIIENVPGKDLRLVAKNVDGIEVTVSENVSYKNVILEGAFETIKVKGNKINLVIGDNTKIDKMQVVENISGVTIDVSKSAAIKELTLDSAAKVNNAKDTIIKINGKRASDSTIAYPPTKTTSGGGGGGGTVSRYTLTLKANPPEGGTVTGQGSYKSGEYVTVTAAANEGYEFVNWTIDGEEVSKAASFEYKMPSNGVILIANFKKTTPPPAQETIVYDTPGTYGPDASTATIDGDVIISAADVTLQNTTINGDLLLDEGIGDGSVTLKGVTVNGATIVKGGGPQSVKVIDCMLSLLRVIKEEVRVIVSGNTSVEKAQVEASASLISLMSGDIGFAIVIISANAHEAQIVLEGTFGTVQVQAPAAKVEIKSGSINNLVINENASGAVIDVANDAEIVNLTVKATIEVTGEGKIEKAEINARDVIINPVPTTIIVAEDASAIVGGEELGPTEPIEPEEPPASGGEETVRASIIASADVNISLDSIKFDYNFYTDEAKLNLVECSEALGSPYYLDPDSSTVKILYKDEEGTIIKQSAEKNLGSLGLSDDGVVIYDNMSLLKDSFGINEEDSWIPNAILLNLKSKTVADGKTIENPWEKTFDIDIAKAAGVFTLNLDRDNLTPYKWEDLQPMSEEDLQSVIYEILLPAKGQFGSRITWEWESENPEAVDISPEILNAETGGPITDFYIAHMIPGDVENHVTLIATLQMDGIDGELTKKINLVIRRFSEDHIITFEGDPPEGMAGEPYSYKFKVNNNIGDTAFALVEGILPDGLSLSSDGTISGTPTSVIGQTENFTVKVSDSYMGSGFKTCKLTIKANIRLIDTVEPGSEKVFSQNGYRVYIPEGAIEEEITEPQLLEIKTVFSGLPEHKYYGDFTPFDEIATYNISIGELKNFAKPLEITIPFDKGKVDSELPLSQAVKLSYYDNELRDWVITGASIDESTGTLNFSTNHLTSWRIEYLIRRYSEKTSAHFSVLYDSKSIGVVPIGRTGFTQEDLSQKVIDYMETAYDLYESKGFTVPTGKTTVIINPKLDQPETSTMLGNIQLSGLAYDSESHLEHDVYHELFHVVERQYFSVVYYLDNAWIMEAMADTAAGICVPTSDKMGSGDDGISKEWFDEPITTRDGSHEYDACYFISYLCGLRGYWRVVGITPREYIYNADLVLRNLKDLVVALDKGGFDCLESIDSWLKSKTPPDELCPDLPTAYLNFVYFCIFSGDSPLVIKDTDGITDTFTTAQDQYKLPVAETPSKTINIAINGLKPRGGICLKTVDIEEGSYGPFSRTAKVKISSGSLPEGVTVMIVRGWGDVQNELHSSQRLFDTSSDPSPTKPSTVFANAARKVYILATNMGTDISDISIEVSDLSEIVMDIQHTVKELKSDEGNIIGYKHTYNIEVSGVLEEWGIDALSVNAMMRNEERLSEFKSLTKHGDRYTGEVLFLSDSPNVEVAFVLGGYDNLAKVNWDCLSWKLVE